MPVHPEGRPIKGWSKQETIITQHRCCLQKNTCTQEHALQSSNVCLALLLLLL
jgi:hypothetical protein